jgi:hypothetical protein
LRDASWLNRRRIRDYATILIAASLAILAWTLTGPGTQDPLGRPVGTDFVSFWTVSWALLHHHVEAVYAPAVLAEFERAIEGVDRSFYAWLYPPIALLIVYPLALLPYLSSLALWLCAGLAGYLAALWRILPRPLTLWAGLAFPAVLVTVEHGQNAFLTTSLAAWGLVFLTTRPVAAGLLLGFLSFKPQLAVLFPLALIAGGHWRAIAAASLTAFGLAATTTLVFGSQIWSDYGAVTPLARDVLDLGLVPHYKMQSVYAAIRLLGGSASAAYGVQIVAAFGAALLVIWAWRQDLDQNLKNAALLVAIPLTTPFILDYDLLLLAPAIVWVAGTAVKKGWIPWERIALAALACDPLAARAFAQHTQLLLTPILVTAVLGLIASRMYLERRLTLRQPRPIENEKGFAARG